MKRGNAMLHGAEFRLSKEPETYDGPDGRCYYLDPTEPTRLRAVGKEENVRQQFITFLTARVDVPLPLLRTEDAVSHYGAASKGRMDIFCKLSNGIPLFVVECKRQGLELEDEQHLRQVHRYAKDICCRLAILTNGDETNVYDCEADDDDLRKGKLKLPRNTVPTFQEMLKLGGRKLTYDLPVIWRRPAWKNLPKSVDELPSSKEGFGEMIGKDTARDRVRWLASLGGLLRDAGGAGNLELDNVEDLGTAWVSPSNPSGGDWRGEYRGFLVIEDRTNSHVVRFAMLAEQGGKTKLVVTVDDENCKTCSLLQLDMKRDTVEQPGKAGIIVWHNGRLPRGEGWTKATLIDYARTHAPRLVDGEYVRLGEIPIGRQVKWEDVREFMTNCIEYALLRKRFKDAY